MARGLFIVTSFSLIGALVQPYASLRIQVSAPFIRWFFSVSTAAFSASLGVDAIVAILLAVKIFEVQRIAKENYTVQKRTVHPIRNHISIFNDSGILMLGCLII